MAKKRNEVEEKYKWDLSPIFKSSNDWNKEFEALSSEIDDIIKYKDIFLNSSNDLLEFLVKNEALERRLNKLFYYAHLNYDSDTLDVKNQERYEKQKNLLTLYSSLVSFFEPTLLKEDYNHILEYCNENKGLEKYRFYFEQLFRYKKHYLSKEVEEVISKLSKTLDAPSEIYSILTNSDIKFGSFIDGDGKSQELTKSNYTKYMMSKNRTTRKNAFELMYKVYSNYKNTIAATFRSNVEYLKEISDLRGYNSSIESSLYADNVDIKIYDNLINTVSDNLSVLYKYYDIKRKALELDELHLYDIYTPLVKTLEKEYSFEEAKSIVIDALSILGEDYIKIINKAFDERWIDVYYNEGKRSGAYSSGFYDTNPYLLLNFEGSLDDVSTLAHELGHSVHTYLSCKNNDYIYSSYKIFVAEVASTVNELLMYKHLLKISNDKNEKLYVLNELLELFKGTIFRQTMFAEFERDMHKLNSEGTILTADLICNKYYELVVKYFGPSVICDEEIKYEWERIPHFYNDFYVYQYATGLASACYIVDGILNNKENAKENYIKFLSSGGSDYPACELKIAGVDINDKEVISSAIKMFDEILEEFNNLYFD